MGDLLAEHVVVGVGVGVHMDQPHRAVLLHQRAQDRQRDGVVATQRERHHLVRQQGVVMRLDDAHRRQQVVGVQRHIAEVGHLRSIVGLVWRSVVLWMVLLALLTLARLLG